MVATKGTRGARLAVKFARAGGWLAQDRLLGALSPTNSNSTRSIAKWGANALVGVSWQATSNTLQGESFNLRDEVLSLIPGVNAGMKIYSAVQKCF